MTSGIETSRWVGGFLRFCGRGGRVSAGGSLTYTTPLRYEARLVDRRSTCARRERRETFCATMCTCENERDRQRSGSYLDVRSPVETLPMSVSIEVRANPLSVTLRFTGTRRRAEPLFRSRRAQVGLRTGARLRQRDRVVPRRGTTSAHPPLSRTRFTLLHIHH